MALTEQLIRTVDSWELYLEEFWTHHQLPVTDLHGKSFNTYVDKDDIALALSAYASIYYCDQLDCPGCFQMCFSCMLAWQLALVEF